MLLDVLSLLITVQDSCRLRMFSLAFKKFMIKLKLMILIIKDGWISSSTSVKLSSSIRALLPTMETRELTL
jgi:hypothetical protein